LPSIQIITTIRKSWPIGTNNSPKPPPERVTITFPVIARATKAIFIATGARTKEIRREIFENPDGRLPDAPVNQALGDRVTWFVDYAAIEGVNYPRRVAL
jgi:6-phosphogluconolactonase